MPPTTLRRYGMWLLLAATLLVLVAAVESCRDRSPLRIGYVGPLSGKGLGLGLGGRDGVQLAVEEANSEGGINGRRIELLIEDDRQEVGQAKAAVQRLIDADARAIVGNMTSSMSVATLPLANEHKVLMLSPTSGGEELTGQDDFFFRLHVPLGVLARELATVLVEQRGVRRVAVVLDDGNRAYTGSFYDQFLKAFVARGGTVVTTITFVSSAQPYYSGLIRSALQSRPEALLLLANGADSALLAQQVAKTGQRPLLLGSEWSVTPELVAMGGRAVDGMFFIHGIDDNSTQPRFVHFVQAFEQRFGYRPGFPSVYAYETVRVLVRALGVNPDLGQLRATIAAIGDFDGLQGPIYIDRYGDPTRPVWPLVIADGRFVAAGAP